VQHALSLLSEWKSDVPADPSQHVGLKKFHLGWVLHALSTNQKCERISCLKLLLTARMKQKASGFQRIATADES
jgi:hypothetical protein